MDNTFEIQKNKKAITYTVVICAVLLAIFILYTWPLHIPVMPTAQDLIEVNLGNEQEGMGNVQPLVKGERARDTRSISSPSKSVSHEEPSRQIKSDENNDPEAASVPKIIKPDKDAKDINNDTKAQPSKTSNPSPVISAAPSSPKPKLPLYKGGTGNGGNGAEKDNGYRNEGYKGGNGDAGSPDGKADSYGNTPGGKSGVSVIRGLAGRRPTHFPSMQDEFNENAKVYVDIKVDASGIVTGASISRGTTTSSSSLISIALQKAKQLKFPPGPNDEESGTILFNFILKN